MTIKRMLEVKDKEKKKKIERIGTLRGERYVTL
jgi:hypothetical protein